MERDFIQQFNDKKTKIIQQFVDICADLGIDYCFIGEIAVNAYVDEPAFSYSNEVILPNDSLEDFLREARKYFRVKEFPHKVALHDPDAACFLEIALNQSHPGIWPEMATTVFTGLELNIPSIKALIDLKLAQYSNDLLPKSKRLKALTSICQIIEKYPEFMQILPDEINALVKK